jgi:threonine dehydrogenase-like Zn-dependent dehydrogenase
MSHITITGGKVVAVGLGPRLIKFPLATASLKELDIVGVCRFDAGSFEQAVMFVEKFKDVLPLVVTHVFPLSDVVNALHVMQSGEGVKFLIDLEHA